jgi:tetratricopeptide (TPR) repeat protein
MSHPGASGSPDRPASGNGSPQVPTPRSSIWQGFLGTASVVSYALLFELARNLLVNSFGENAGVKFVAGTLRWAVVLLFAVAAGYVLYRYVTDRREIARVAHELELLADLVEPGPPVRTSDADECPRPRRVSTLDGDEIAVLLRDMPVYEYETAALLAVLTAVSEARARLPSDQEPRQRTAVTLLEQAVRQGILAPHGPDRYCVRMLPEPGAVVAGSLWQAALPALLHHYADRATRWAIALESTRFAAGARRWFEAEETYLRTLISECAQPSRSALIPAIAVPELSCIIDALDVWHARRGLPENESGVVDDLCGVERLADFPLHQELARMRAGQLDERPQKFRPRRFSTSLAARWAHRAGLDRLAAAPDDLPAVVRQLEAAWWLLPRADIAGEVCALVNLAVIHVQQGRLDAAQDRLELAESLTRTGRDPAGRAHTHEISGALWWSRGEPRRALRCWQLALTEYRTLADDLGTGRCLQHLGSAMVVAPGLGGLLLGTDPPLTDTEVLRQASGWLAHARTLHPTAHHAEYYADEAHSALARPRGTRRGALRRIDRWPLPVTEPSATGHR